jgi:hypothetical protein
MSVPPGTEMFQFPGFASSDYQFIRRYPRITRVGCPIRTPTDQRLLAAPRGFAQRATSFFASWCQGIHRMPFSCSKPLRGPAARTCAGPLDPRLPCTETILRFSRQRSVVRKASFRPPQTERHRPADSVVSGQSSVVRKASFRPPQTEHHRPAADDPAWIILAQCRQDEPGGVHNTRL